MKIAIIGGGFTGLSAAYELTKFNNDVTLFERESYLGGLAWGWKEKNWKWSLEKSYHHLFTSDSAIIGLAKELGIERDLIIKRPITANLLPSQTGGVRSGSPVEQLISANVPSMMGTGGNRSGSPVEQLISAGRHAFSSSATQDMDGKTTVNRLLGGDAAKSMTTSAQEMTHFASGNIAQLDSPLHLLQFPGLSISDKLRTGALVAFCKLYPFWQTLENVTAEEFFVQWGGKRAWEIIWEPLMTGKFGHFDDTIAASWLWARLNKRTSNLVYVKGGFEHLITTLSNAIALRGGLIKTSAVVESMKPKKDGTIEIMVNGQPKLFDKVLLTAPTPIALRLMPKLPQSYTKPLLAIPHLSAQVLILETDKPILDATYWLSITDRSFPFLAVVGHTNFMDPANYGGHHITYIGNYLPNNHRYLSMNKQQLLKEFLPYLLRLNPNLKSEIFNLKSYLFTGPFAQPVHQLHYSRVAPKFETPIPNIFLANMDSIVPWDRGTNYAVELGQKAAAQIHQ